MVLASDLDPTPDPAPWVSLLPALDPTVMGWSDRSWFLGPHARALFDGTGNAGPTIWLSGRVVGGWAQRPDGEIATRLLEDVGADAAALIEAEAELVAGWLKGVRVIPRFRTPVERELSG
jgi:Winged helix DNA-binding domain